MILIFMAGDMIMGWTWEKNRIEIFWAVNSGAYLWWKMKNFFIECRCWTQAEVWRSIQSVSSSLTPFNHKNLTSPNGATLRLTLDWLCLTSKTPGYGLIGNFLMENVLMIGERLKDDDICYDRAISLISRRLYCLFKIRDDGY